jgi:pimeloyl-ACP methyl ester carboxylesterase
LGFPAELRPVLGEVADHSDLIGFDPRFVGLSTPINCGGIGEYVRAAGLGWRDYAESVEYARGIAERCWRTAADHIRYASTRNTARDVDVIRAVLGEPRLSYVGVSYGTYVGAVYMQMFRERADRACQVSERGQGADWGCSPSTGTGFGGDVNSVGALDWGHATGRGWTDANGDGRSDYCRRVGTTNHESSHVACTMSRGGDFTTTVVSGVTDWGYQE